MKKNPGRKERRKLARAMRMHASSKHYRKGHINNCPLLSKPHKEVAATE